MHLHRLLSGQSLLHQRNNLLLQTLLGKNNRLSKNKLDAFVKSDHSPYIANTYNANLRKKKEYISDDILDIINNDISQLRKHGNLYECKGISFSVDQIPELDGSSFQEVKAINNTIDFGKENYFKYISEDGNEHYLYSDNKGVIGSVNSEVIRGVPHDVDIQKFSGFWNRIMGDTTFLGLNYPQQEKINYLKAAGIQPGFFTVKMGDCESTKFYSSGENSVVIYEKEHYDERYRNLTKEGNLLRHYEPGSVFKFGGKEYVVKNDHTIDIPYGEDLFAIEAPSNYKFGKKID